METRADATGGPNDKSSERASILSATGGTVEIQGGQFNATAGHHISVTINTGNELPSTSMTGSKLPSEEEHLHPTDNRTERLVPHERSYDPTLSASNFQPSTPLERSCDIYYRHIGAKGRGSPLWIPGPNQNLHIEYQRKGISIGDVGIITADGRFDFLFNICLPCDHPINPPVLPENFTPLYLPQHEIQQYSEFNNESYLSSSSVRKSHRTSDTPGLVFESSASEGAILAMPMGSNSAQLANIRLFRKYAATHAEDWYRYANDSRGREAGNGDLRLVVGYDKTTKWGMATFSNSSASSGNSLLLKFRPLEPQVADSEKTYGWEFSGMAEVRAGPDRREIQDLRAGDPSEEISEYENQCLFIRTLNPTLSDKIWNRLLLELGDIDVPDEATSDTNDSFIFSSNDSTSNTWPSTPDLFHSASGKQKSSKYINRQGGKEEAHSMNTSSSVVATTCHPSNVINDLILASYPEARMVITEDNDWISVLSETDHDLPPPSLLYARMLGSFAFKLEGDMVHLEKRVQNPDVNTGLPTRPAVAPPVTKQRYAVCHECHIRGIRCTFQEADTTTCSHCKILGLSCRNSIHSDSKPEAKNYTACLACQMRGIRCTLEDLPAKSYIQGEHPSCRFCDLRGFECSFWDLKREEHHETAYTATRAKYGKRRAKRSSSPFIIPETRLSALADAFASFEEYSKQMTQATSVDKDGDFQMKDAENITAGPSGSNH